MPDYHFEGMDPFESRRAKLAALRELGIDPYPAKVPPHDLVATVRGQGEGLVPGAPAEATQTVAVAGRITAIRGQGALTFVDLRDETGKIQLLLRRDTVGDERFDQLQLLDLGDFLWAAGSLMVTARGELSIEAREWQLLAKALRPLPDLWHGLQDSEQRQRQRYAELLVNETTRERFRKRSQFIAAIRRYLGESGFTEVETPVLEHIPGGADAEPFVTHHRRLDVDFYLRISLELHLKRLVVGGFERVFEIGRVFRNEGLSPQHLQEFSMLEFYWAYAACDELLGFVERFYTSVIQEVFGSLQVQRGEVNLDFTPPWPRAGFVDLLQQYTGVHALEASIDEIAAALANYREEVDRSLGRGRLLDQLYKKAVRPNLIQPQFVVDWPVELSPLAKRKADDPRLTERLIVLIDGAEIGNGFTELNDPQDQRQRFEEQERLRLAGDPEAQRMDTDFLRALEYGMPPTAGFGVGIDRFLTVLLDLDSIRETVFFPTMRPESGE